MQTTPRRSPAHPPPRQPWPPQPATASVRAEDLPVARSRLPRELSSSCTVSVAQRRCSSQRRRSPAHGAGAPRRPRRPALPNASAAVVALPPCVSLEAGGCPPLSAVTVPFRLSLPGCCLPPALLCCFHVLQRPGRTLGPRQAPNSL